MFCITVFLLFCVFPLFCVFVDEFAENVFHFLKKFLYLDNFTFLTFIFVIFGFRHFHFYGNFCCFLSYVFNILLFLWYFYYKYAQLKYFILFLFTFDYFQLLILSVDNIYVELFKQFFKNCCLIILKHNFPINTKNINLSKS